MTFDSSLATLYAIGKKLGFAPDFPLGAEDFFRTLIETYDGDDAGFQSWIETKANENYLALNARPIWKQDPEWPLSKGRPMTFVGQIDHRFSTNETSFYLFWDRKTGHTTTIVQVLS